MTDETPHLHWSEDDNTFHELQPVGEPFYVRHHYSFELDGETAVVDDGDFSGLKEMHRAIVAFFINQQDNRVGNAMTRSEETVIRIRHERVAE